MEATVAVGSTRSPHKTIMISYHHHSKQTDMQLGAASLSNGMNPAKLKHSKLGFVHVGLCNPETRNIRIAILDDADAAATPATPRVRFLSWWSNTRILEMLSHKNEIGMEQERRKMMQRCRVIERSLGRHGDGTGLEKIDGD
ncbi:hypothetical protein Lal_00016586 [Lupinus albus]|nr:hypothetical protein Lal_00016586 [Lupinus albus]